MNNKTISLQNLENVLNTFKSNNDKQMDDYIISLEDNAYSVIENPLISNIENHDIPVGTILEFPNKYNIDYYLPCDGSIYNIEDYQYLASYFENVYGSSNIYGGDGITTFAVPNININEQFIVESVLPKMTSLTTPSPYVITVTSKTASSINWSEQYNSVKMFDKDKSTAWCSIDGKDVTIIIDLGKHEIVNRMSVINYSNTTYINKYTIEASNNNIDYTILYTEMNNPNKNTFFVDFNNKNKGFRYYKLDVTNFITASNYMGIYELDFFKTIQITKKYIKSTPATLAINQYGGFHSEVLFDGNANTIGEYELEDNINNYDFIMIEDKYEYSDKSIISETVASPTMTSNTHPSGKAFGNSVLTNYNYYHAFDSLINSSWTSSTIVPNYIGYNFETPTDINAYSITSRNFDGNDLITSPNTWIFQGSDNGSNWIDLDNRNNIKWDTKGQTKIFYLASDSKYLYYRLYITKNNGHDYSSVGEFTLKYVEYAHPGIYSSSLLIQSSNTKSQVMYSILNDSKILFNLEENKMNISEVISNTTSHSISKVIGYKGSISMETGGEL